MPSVKKGNLSIAPKKSTKAPAKKTTTTKATAKKTVAKKAAPAKKTTTTKKTTATATKKSNTTKPKTSTKPSAKKTETKATIPTESKTLYQHYREGNHDIDLEPLCQLYLKNRPKIFGTDIKRTNDAKDGGVDIICKKYDDYDDLEKVFYVQVKNKKVDVKIVRELIGSIATHSKKYGDEYTKHIGVIMTSLTATADAKKEGKAHHMLFIEGTALEKDDKARTKL